MQQTRPGLVTVIAALVVATPALGSIVPARQAAASCYAYVAAESDDTVALVRFAPTGPGAGTLSVVNTIPVGVWPGEIEGPHGLAMAPDGSAWPASTAPAQSSSTNASQVVRIVSREAAGRKSSGHTMPLRGESDASIVRAAFR